MDKQSVDNLQLNYKNGVIKLMIHSKATVYRDYYTLLVIIHNQLKKIPLPLKSYLNVFSNVYK